MAAKAIRSKMNNLQLTAEQQEVITKVMQGKGNYFITGPAGAGKSVVLRKLRELMHKEGWSVGVCAPTGIAALHVNGQTINSLLGIGPVNHKYIFPMGREKRAMIQMLDVLIIDEVSMVSADMLDHVDRMFKTVRENRFNPFGGVRIVAFGDMYQLNPVNAEMPFKGVSWDLQKLELKKIHRQSDGAWKDFLEAMKLGELTDEQMEWTNPRVRIENDAPRLCFRNEDVELWNNIKLDQLKGQEHTFHAVKGGIIEKWDETKIKKNSTMPDVLKLKVGAKVMMLNNDRGGRWVNGSTGYVESLVPYIKVRINDQVHDVDIHSADLVEPVTIEVENEDGTITKVVQNRTAGYFRQYPMRLGYAVTIHKSQGMTLEQAEINLGNSNMTGLAYVAFSRIKSYEGLFLAHKLQRFHIKTDPGVKKFMTTIQP
jgi:ATP-dependent exoDNAse (exonuclease V), alpha subunit - helicase superfamily I member